MLGKPAAMRASLSKEMVMKSNREEENAQHYCAIQCNSTDLLYLLGSLTTDSILDESDRNSVVILQCERAKDNNMVLPSQNDGDSNNIFPDLIFAPKSSNHLFTLLSVVLKEPCHELFAHVNCHCQGW